jgi:Arc/MetJ-type ribon-helix-helix transcriptional regulator
MDLSPENRAYLESAIAAGTYPSAIAAMDEAVILLRRRDEVRRKLQAAVEQADRGELIPAEQVFSRLEQQALAIQRQASSPS